GTAAVDVVDVVIRIERMSLPGIAAEVAFVLDAEALKEHDRDVHPLVLRCLDASAYAIKVGLVKKLHVKLRLAVRGFSRSRALVRHRVVGGRALFRIWVIRAFPGPEPKEVVIMFLEEAEVRLKVERRRRGLRGVCDVLKVGPSVRTRQ